MKPYQYYRSILFCPVEDPKPETPRLTDKLHWVIYREIKNGMEKEKPNKPFLSSVSSSYLVQKQSQKLLALSA